MRKIAMLIAILCLATNYGCIAYTLGVVAGTVVRIPFEVTGQVLEGFGEGVFGTYSESDDSYTSRTEGRKISEEPKKALIRDKRGNIVF